MAKIDFEKIPNSIRKPSVLTEYNNKDAVTTLPNNEQEVLIVAPMVGGEADFTAPQKIFSDKEAEALFGAGSVAHLMVRQAILNNSLIRLTVVGLKDHSAGIAATAQVTFTGTVSYAGVVSVIIAGTAYEVAAAKSEEARTIVSRLVNVINTSVYSPVVASVERDTTLKLTAKVKGEIGNEITLATRSTATGLNLDTAAFETVNVMLKLPRH